VTSTTDRHCQDADDGGNKAWRNQMTKRKNKNILRLLLAGIMTALFINACAIDQKKTEPGTHLSDSSQKKKQFFDLIRPAAIAENRKLDREHTLIVQLNHKRLEGHPIPAKDRAWLLSMAHDYKIEHPDLTRDNTWQQLLERVDIIPLELVLAQAANESAWGTSRFAREGHNYFGQWCYQKGCGLVPRHRQAGATHEVARYASARESVKSYMHNLNSSPAYAQLRKIRAHARKRNHAIDAIALAEGLNQYSERGQQYVRSLQNLIRSNAAIMRQSS